MIRGMRRGALVTAALLAVAAPASAQSRTGTRANTTAGQTCPAGPTTTTTSGTASTGTTGGIAAALRQRTAATAALQANGVTAAAL